MHTLAAEERTAVGTKAIRKLRSGGKLPAVLYGGRGEARPIAVSAKDFGKVLAEAGESSLVRLTGLPGEPEVLIYDVDIDPVSGRPRHADFYLVEKGKKVQVKVPLAFIGTAPAVKELGGVLVKVLHELEVEAEPKDLPQEIAVDVSGLADFEGQIFVRDIKLPPGVAALAKEDEVVAMASQAKEEEEAPPASIDLSAIEVEKRGKEKGVEGAPTEGPPEEKNAS